MRYSHQLLISDGFGVLGQRKLLSSSVLVVGAGGIGSNRLLFLATISVVCITVVYHDNLEVGNLQVVVVNHSYASHADGGQE